MGDANPREPSPRDIVFSCTVCQATVSEVYRDADSDKGFHDGNHGEKQRPVTKLWLTECSHITCSKHFDGGGVPFHRSGEQPHAICPVCRSQKNDARKKALYAIRGFSEDQLDPKIPKEWFDVPPMLLTGKGKGMEAMQFQYLNLLNFGVHMETKLRQAKESAQIEAKRAKEESDARKRLTELVETLRRRVAELERCEVELKPWKDREPQIKFYLGLFPKITTENERLREQLTAMGYAVPIRSYALHPSQAIGNEQPSQNTASLFFEEDDHRIRTSVQNGFYSNKNPQRQAGLETGSDRTLSGSTDQGPNLYASAEESVQPANKHPREESSHPYIDQAPVADLPPRGTSRDLMPPPPLPSNKRPRHGVRERDLGFKQTPRHEYSYLKSGDNLSNSSEHTCLLEGPGNLMKQNASGDRNFTNHSIGARDLSGHQNKSPQQNGANDISPERAYNRHQENLQTPSMMRTSTRKMDEIEKIYSKSNSPRRRPRDDYERQWNHNCLGDSHPENDRNTLQEWNPSKLNLEAYRHESTPRVERFSSNAEFRDGSGQGGEFQGPRTPSPAKRLAERNIHVAQPQSVVSPFFSRQNVMQHSGRITLPTPKKRTVDTRSPPKQSFPQTPSQLHQFPQNQRSVPRKTPVREYGRHSSQQSSAFMSDGLFRRPDSHAQPSTQTAASPYFQPRTANNDDRPALLLSTPRSSASARQIPTLGSSTPSIRSNTYMDDPRALPRTIPAFKHRDEPGGRASLTDFDLGYNRDRARRHDRQHEHDSNGAGLRSGASRPSQELSWGPSNPNGVSVFRSGGFRGTRRTVQR